MELRMSHGFEIMSFFCSGPMTVFRACSLQWKKKARLAIPKWKWCSKHARCRELTSLQSCIQMQMEPAECSMPKSSIFLPKQLKHKLQFSETTSASHLVCCWVFANAESLFDEMNGKRQGGSIHSIKNKMTESNETLFIRVKTFSLFLCVKHKLRASERHWPAGKYICFNLCIQLVLESTLKIHKYFPWKCRYFLHLWRGK